MKDRLLQDIMALGGDIVTSERFALAKKVPHHTKSRNIALHSMETAGYALLIADWLEEHGLPVSHTTVVRAALLHDIGMTEPSVFYSPSHKKAFSHPRMSARIAKEEFGADESQVEAIRHHMFPVWSTPPRSVEGWVVSLADKCCSLNEVRKSTGRIVAVMGRRILRWYRRATWRESLKERRDT